MVSDELPGAAPGADDFEALRSQVADEQKKSAENLAGWQRAAADFANYRKRTEQEKNDLLKFGNSGLILKVLPVLDDFERAVATMPPPKISSTRESAKAAASGTLQIMRSAPLGPPPPSGQCVTHRPHSGPRHFSTRT